LLESHATRESVDSRRVDLEKAGYNVVVTPLDLPADGEFLQREGRKSPRSAFRDRDHKTDL
jgi:hypothetical protein